MDLGAITSALGGLLGGGGDQQPQQPQQQGGGGGFSLNPSMIGALMPAAMGLINSAGGIGGILDKFTGGGDEEEAAAAQSWVADGPNQPLSPQQVRHALGPEVDRVAQQAGIPVAEAEAGLAEMLPQVVDTMTPGGQMPSLDDIGSIMGKLFK